MRRSTPRSTPTSRRSSPTPPRSSANERFALSYPEKRPFFLEGVDLFSTPIQAVYTRTITSPRGGLRATGRARLARLTALVTHDRGGGVVVLPDRRDRTSRLRISPRTSASRASRRDFGSSFVSALFTGRAIEGGGDNFVGGPDFQWRPDPSNNVTGQALWSRSRTPNRPDLAAEWDGRTLEDRALLLYGQHGSTHFDWFLQGLDVGPDFPHRRRLRAAGRLPRGLPRDRPHRATQMTRSSRASVCSRSTGRTGSPTVIC